MNETELRARLAALYAEGTPLVAKSKDGTLTADEESRLDQIANEVADLKPKFDEAVKRRERAESLGRDGAAFTQPAGTRASGMVPHARERRQDEREPDHWTVGDRVVRSEQFRAYQRNVGQGGAMTPVEVGSFYEPHLERQRLDREAEDPPEGRALITSTVVTALIEPYRIPGIVAGEDRPLRVRDVMNNQQTSSNLIEFVREDTVTNNAAEVAEATSLSTGLKPESGFTLATDSAPVRTIAHLMYATRASLSDVPALRGMIDDQLRRGIDEREDRQLLLGNGVAPNLRGIANTPGIQVLDGAYWEANPLPTAGAAANKWDRLLRALTRIRLAGRDRASAIMMNPAQVEEFLMYKVNTGAYAFAPGGPLGSGNVPTMWGRPIVEVEDVPDNVAYVGAFATRSIVFDRMESQIYATDSNRDLFERNIITILGESRLALVVTRPIAFAEVDLVATEGED